MQINEQTKALLRAMEPLSAYGEFAVPDETLPLTEQPAAPSRAAKVFRPVNHLATALSPYLRLHAADPVGWYSWGAEAFSVALREDRPLFVNIGFYSEHWCRQMHNDCFTDSEVAGLINDVCIPVCVDRELRPDINNLFTEACILQNGSAGWPLNVFLTPEGKPFFCTTWLPKRTIGAMPGITEILPRVKWLWHVQRQDVENEAQRLALLLRARLAELSGAGSRARRIKSIAFEAVNDLRSVFDVQWGGFGGTPKFPEAVKLLFLLLQAGEKSTVSKHDKSDAFSMTDITLRRMWRGGIHDHLGGGFSRYAVDERWLVPHFEKLLMDQAALLYVASLAQELQDGPFHRMFAEDIIFCVTKYFALDTAYSQGFRSSVCGDNAAGEGRFYLWTEDDIKHVLGVEVAPLFCAAYGVLPGGNFGSELGGTPIGQNILYEASTVKDLAKRFALKERDVAKTLHDARHKLLEARDTRQLLTDDKILMGANGLMIAALSKASVVFDASEWKDIAERSALFLAKNLKDKEGRYYRAWVDGHLEGSALAEDYAYFLWGLVELYRACKHFNSGEKQLTEWLNTAQSIADTMTANYWDDVRGGFVLSDKSDACLAASIKSAEDLYSLPNVNALSAIIFTELGKILEDKKYNTFARRIIDCFAGFARHNYLRCLTMIAADELYTPLKVKPVVAPTPPTDEELNAEIAPPPAKEADDTTTKAGKTASRSRTERAERSDAAKRRRTQRRSRDR